jgi:hypothetical protein
MSTQLLGEILTVLVFVSAVGLAVLVAGFALDAWWCRCETMERRERHADLSE